MNYIYGINAVAEALKARGRSFEWVGVLKERHDLRLQRVVEECRRNRRGSALSGRPELDRMAGNNAHQGVVAVTSAKQYNDLDDVIAAKRGDYSLLWCWTESKIRTIWARFFAPPMPPGPMESSFRNAAQPE